MRPQNGHGYFKKTEYQKNTFLICINIKSIIKMHLWKHDTNLCMTTSW